MIYRTESKRSIESKYHNMRNKNDSKDGVLTTVSISVYLYT